jgi:hypothetical protein
MAQPHENNSVVSDEDRRDFLKALGVAGVAAGSGVTLNEVRNEMTAGTSEELAEVGQAIQSDLQGELDPSLIASQQAAMAEATQELAAVPERGLPTEEPREEFAAAEAAARPVYEHIRDVGFFESTTEHLPQFSPEYLSSAVQTLVASEAFAEPLAELGFTDGAGVELLSTVIGNAERLSHHHWVATDTLPREEIAIGDEIPPMTQMAAGGPLLWLRDMDKHIWQSSILLDNQILTDGTWHAQSMMGGFYLMSEGARSIGAGEGALGESELAALLSTGFAVQAISQNLLPPDFYWITEEMSAGGSADYEIINKI